jgi:hypothetical protein
MPSFVASVIELTSRRSLGAIFITSARRLESEDLWLSECDWSRSDCPRTRRKKHVNGYAKSTARRRQRKCLRLPVMWLYTTVPATRMSAAHCIELYRLRWQVEICHSYCHRILKSLDVFYPLMQRPSTRFISYRPEPLYLGFIRFDHQSYP